MTAVVSLDIGVQYKRSLSSAKHNPLLLWVDKMQANPKRSKKEIFGNGSEMIWEEADCTLPDLLRWAAYAATKSWGETSFTVLAASIARVRRRTQAARVRVFAWGALLSTQCILYAHSSVWLLHCCPSLIQWAGSNAGKVSHYLYDAAYNCLIQVVWEFGPARPRLDCAWPNYNRLEPQ